MNTRRILPTFFCLVVSLLFIFNPSAQADERILAFESEIVVRPDSSLKVTETIRVRAEGRKIKRGIYRDFPTRYKDNHGNEHRVGFDVAMVMRDDVSEPFHLEKISNGVRVYIGRRNRHLSPGEYTYEIIYHTDRQLGYFDDYDELYWNVTGNGWDFPIDQVTATIDLPGGAIQKVMSKQGFTGFMGSREEAVRVWFDFLERLSFETLRPLQAREGLTIVATWPKGFVEKPSESMSWHYFWQDHLMIIVACFGAVGIMGFYLWAWILCGRDPKKGTIIPLFHAPDGFSPGMMRCLMKMDYDKKAFTAGVLDLAVRGFIKIEERSGTFGFGKTYKLIKLKDADDDLPPEEKMVLFELFGSGVEIDLKNENYRNIQAAIAAFNRSLIKKVEKTYFFSNEVYTYGGIAASVVFGLIIFSLLDEGGWTTPLALGLLVTVGLVNIIFYRLMKAPTLKGRRIMDKIEGFKMYLSIAEKDRLNVLNPPQKTPELFEKYLPYALALDVEQKWAEQFAEVFEWMEKGGAAYRPGWYSGKSWSRFDAGNFSSDLGGSFSSAISSSSVAPGSSSGSGGGGFSGGGGGGGGGGGW